MKLVPTIKYNVQDIITKTIPVYYGVFTFLVLLLLSLSKISSLRMSGSFSGLSFNSTILLIILGLVFTRASFRYLTQMGVSRKTQFAAKVIGILLISAVVVVADRLLDMLVTVIFNSTDLTYEMSEISYMLFADKLSELHPFAREMTVIGLAFTSRVMFFAATVFIAMLYVRMNTVVKVVVSVGVPLLTIFGTPALARFFPEQMGNLIRKIAEISGLSDGQPVKSILCMVGVAVVFMGLFYLATRRAPIKD